MPKYDMVLITTVEAESFAAAENWLIDFADGLATTEYMPFTAVGHTDATDDYGRRVIFLHAEDETSPYTGPTTGPNDA